MKREDFTKKIKVLLDNDGNSRKLVAVLNPKKITQDGKFIKIGGYFSDEVQGYYELDKVLESVITILETFEEIDE